ncbi:hypothetical protein NIES37_69780 (plasmid) [Tolypothrix tenuis PCC 7101]|uniref:Uncharacterized protein n=1 Tax=Tolypothrix tenuis PCC 7101 TaxID=231146 RepID=A0A1Z4NBA5_9CYAN|nr:hypothetical protein [Aulosira sp. FACHB-113]BAZ02965.1 hypothetical protein NIES37_69780 [Tolypothrix tenuis PCC 7101]BAZ78112.1 hypothetical protein NIES50_67450 [Aulosira laxa NIES-50]
MVNISARKTAKPSRKIERHIPALERVMTYQEKVHLMVVEVLREESGRELAAAARFNGIVFDWDKHNSQFRKDYVNTPLKELVNYARRLYGLNNLDEIRDRRASHKAARFRRMDVLNSLSSNSNDLINDDFEEDEDDEDIEIDD